MNANDTCTVTLTVAQAKLVKYALLKHWDLINGLLDATKKAASLADIDATIDQLDRFLTAASKKVAE